MAAAGGAIRIFPHMLQLSGFVFERGGTCREPSHEPRPTDQLDDGRPNMPPSAFPMDYPIRFDMFLNRISVSRLFFRIQIGVDFSSGNFTAVFELGGHVAIISKQQ
jgi:hypothetical protein